MIADHTFAWAPATFDGRQEERGAMLVPATVLGPWGERRVALQLDTGVFHSVVYSNALKEIAGANPSGVAADDGVSVRLHSFADAGVDPVRRFGVYQMTSPLEEVAGLLLAGTLGLDALVGQVTWLDFERRRCVIFPAGEREGPRFSGFEFRGGRIWKGHFYLECTLGGDSSLNLIFDTGSCRTNVACASAHWPVIVDCSVAPTRRYVVKGASWGRDIEIIEAPVVADLVVSGVALKGRVASRASIDGKPAFDGTPGLDGLVGCAPFDEAGAVVLDLHRNEFGVAKPRPGAAIADPGQCSG
jgi:hypothetical protein